MADIRALDLRVITLMEMPEAVRGFSYPDKSGYTIMLNGNDTAERREEAFLHECRHIWRGDHERETTVGIVETEQPRKATEITVSLTEDAAGKLLEILKVREGGQAVGKLAGELLSDAIDMAYIRDIDGYRT